MLTEGWDCQRVTHILGYRKFGSQLLCEQTMGRALRRRDYENLEDVERRDNKQIERRFPAEYATVFGVPFARQTVQGKRTRPTPPEPKTKVHPVPEPRGQVSDMGPGFRELHDVRARGRVSNSTQIALLRHTPSTGSRDAKSCGLKPAVQSAGFEYSNDRSSHNRAEELGSSLQNSCGSSDNALKSRGRRRKPRACGAPFYSASA